MSLKDAFITLVNYILQYKTNYKLLTATVFGSFKRNFSAEYKKLVEYNENNEITKTNFHESIINLVLAFNSTFNENPFEFTKFTEFINDVTDRSKFAEICGSPNEKFFDFDQISTLNIVNENYMNKVKLISMPDLASYTQMQKQLQELLAQKDNNNHAKEKNLPANFSDAFRLFQIQFLKRAKNENHIRLFETHLSNNTVPPSLLWNNFPKPLLPCDQYYVSEFRKLIQTFQTNALKLNIECCNIRTNENIELINSYKLNYTSTENLNEKLENIKNTAYKSLESEFKESSEKISRYYPQQLPLASLPHLKDVSFNNSNRQSSHSTPNSQNRTNKRQRNNSNSRNNSFNTNNDTVRRQHSNNRDNSNRNQNNSNCNNRNNYHNRSRNNKNNNNYENRRVNQNDNHRVNENHRVNYNNDNQNFHLDNSMNL